MISKLLFRLARTSLLGAAVRFGFAHLSALLPVRRVRETRHIIAFDHPRPSWQQHILFVPKLAIPSLLHVGAAQVPLVRQIFLLALDTAARMGLDAHGFVVMVNGGAYQDVGQLHLHLASPADELRCGCSLPASDDVLAGSTSHQIQVHSNIVIADRRPCPRRPTHIVLKPKSDDAIRLPLGAWDTAFVDASILATQELARRLQLEPGGYTLLIDGRPGAPSREPRFHLVGGDPTS
jgi:diadenosine tetraphosphate (Ap4A) HIT family hydrolase